MPEPVDVFISCAYEDRALREDLEKHLAPLKRSGSIRIWDREQIGAGEERLPALYRRIDLAHVILLLLSPDFLSSDYCQNVEMKRIRERWSRREIHVVPVILRSCNWMDNLDGFERLKALPEDGRPVTSWPTRDQAFANVATGVRRLLQKLQEGETLTPAPRSNRSFISQTAIDAALVGAPPSSSPRAASRAGPAAGRASLPSAAPALSASAPRSSWTTLLAWTTAILALLLIFGVTMVVAGSREGGWMRSSPSDPPSSLPTPPPPSRSPIQPATEPLTCSVAPCCGGTECAPSDQNTAGSVCDSATAHCASCPSGRTCVPGACGASLHPRRAFLLRLARVDAPVALPPGAEVCVKKAGAPAWNEQCTAVIYAADLPGSVRASGMRTRLPITPADLLGSKGLDIELRVGGTPIASRSRAVVKGSTVLTSALCTGLFFDEVGPARVFFYLDDP
jgi:hypothetical protein